MASSLKLVWASTSNSNWSGQSLWSINPLLIYLERNTTAKLLVIYGNKHSEDHTRFFHTCMGHVSEFRTHLWVTLRIMTPSDRGHLLWIYKDIGLPKWSQEHLGLEWRL